MQAGKVCCLRHVSSVERNTVRKLGIRNIPRYECHPAGIDCTRCGMSACIECLTELVDQLPPSHAADKWCKDINEYWESGTYPKEFVGHCCELSDERQKVLQEPPPQRTRYDGHLYLPEFSLFIDSPFDCVDVHGFGGSKKVKPAWHCVVSHKSAEAYYSNNVVLSPFATRDTFVRFVEIPSPYSSDLKLKLKVRIRTVYQTHKFDILLAGRNDLSPEEITLCSVVSARDPTCNDIDIDIITGRFDDCPERESLLLFRVYNFEKRLLERERCPSNDDLQALYKACLKRCKKKGFEAQRLGGSSGLPVLDYRFFQFLHFHGSFPRKAAGVKIVKFGRGWKCFYMRVRCKPGQSKVASFVYSPPKRGGQFTLLNSIVERHPFLYDFAETKIIAALVLDELNKNVFTVPVQDAAVHYELSMLEVSRKKAYGTVTAEGLEAPSKPSSVIEVMEWKEAFKGENFDESFVGRLRHRLLEQYIAKNKNTIVQHPVGFHRDIFADGKECLENKFCFVLHGQHRYDPMGRGGRGPKRHVVAFIDWAR